MDDAALTDLIEDAIADGRLPTIAATSIIGKYGDGTACNFSNARIFHSDVMYVLHFCDAHQRRSLLVHYRCFELWDTAMRRPVLRLVTLAERHRNGGPQAA